MAMTGSTLKKTLGAAALSLVLVLGSGLVGLGACKGPAASNPKKAGAGARGSGGEVAVVTLTGNMVEEKELGDLFGPKALTLRGILKRFKKAARDSNVGTVVLRVGSFATGWAQVEELRLAMERLKRAKKKVVVHLDEPTNLTYYLALAGDEVQVSPTSSMWLVGLRSEVVFLKGLLDKVGIQADMTQVGRYKGAAEPLTREEMSPALKTSLGGLLDGLYGEFLGQVMKARKLDKAKAQKLVDTAPHSAEEAKKSGLVDRVATFRTTVRELAKSAKIHWSYAKKKKAGSWSELLELLQPETTGKPPKEPHVALVYAVGPIVYGGRRGGLLVDEKMISSHEMEKLMDELADEDKVKAVILRINSPGGSALASDLIWHAVRRLADKKPVIVSMGDVAASGGYYIAAAGTRIIAQPMTVTGSIGVVGGKISLGGLFDKLGVKRQVLKRGARADIFAPNKIFSDDERAEIKKLMTSTYEVFLERVATSRKMSKGAVKRGAEGRVWTGRKAKSLGLVDRIGGLYTALAEARKVGKLPVDAKVAVYPRPKSWLELLQRRLSPDGVSIGTMLHSGSSSVRGAWIGLKAVDPGLVARLKRLLVAIALCHREKALTLLPYDITIR